MVDRNHSATRENVITGVVAAAVVIAALVFFLPGLLDMFDVGQSHAETAAEDVQWCMPYAPHEINVAVPSGEAGRKAYYDTFVARGWTNILVYNDDWEGWRMEGTCPQAGKRAW